jgi:hypothetical protein
MSGRPCNAPIALAGPIARGARVIQGWSSRNRRLADGSSRCWEETMPGFWLTRRRSDRPGRECTGFRPSDPDQARRRLEQAPSIIEQAIHLHRGQ